MTAYVWQQANLSAALAALSPHWHGEFTGTATRIITDTRKLEPGDIFLAIKGDNFDGHDYLQTAHDKGAVLAIVSRQVDSALPQLITRDTKLALGQLGGYRRAQHPNLKVVAITGSSGKTTAKEMLGSILGRLAPTLITRGNLNNDLGVPMMLLELTDEHRFAVMELGANHVAEIAYTTQLVKPDVACVLNIGTAHLGEFGGRDNIAKAKSEIYQGLTQAGVAVVPFGDDYADVLAEQAQRFTEQVLTFGEQTTTFAKAGVAPQDYEGLQMSAEDTVLLMGDVFADDVEVGTPTTFSLNINLLVDEIESAEVTLPFAGEHNVSNALAAATCAMALGVGIGDIATGLAQAKPAKGRLNFIPLGHHTLIDDTYNANPPAVLAGVSVLNAQPSRHMVVLGDMGELGDQAVSEHAKLGADIAAIGVGKLFAIGDLMAHTVSAAQAQGVDARHFADKQALTEVINDTLSNDEAAWTILFKGSRFMAMESILQAVQDQHAVK